MRGAAYGEDEILDELVTRLAGIPEYVTLFEAAFGPDSVNATNLARAIAAFERTLVPIDSSFDRYLAGDDGAMTAAQLRGMHGFIYQGCSRCHSGPMLSDYQLHSLPVPPRIGEITDPTPVFNPQFGEFRTPSLRMVTRTAPYGHNGVYPTLVDVLESYHNIDHHIEVDPLLQEDDVDVEVAHGQGDDMLAFLEALSDGTFDATIPERVPSGLPPGGAR
jgi:cytochrome c peroxidase